MICWLCDRAIRPREWYYERRTSQWVASSDFGPQVQVQRRRRAQAHIPCYETKFNCAGNALV